MSRMYPLFMNNFVLPIYDIARGTSRFRAGLVLEKTQWFSQREIQKLRNDNLHTLLKHAYESVPYYRKMFKERKLLPSDIKDPNDLTRLPILTKDDIRKNFGELISNRVPKGGFIPCQSGGSGSPIKFYITKEKSSWEIAAEYRAYSWAGYRLGDRSFKLWGSPLDLSRSKGIIRGFAKRLERERVMDTYVISNKVLDRFAYLLMKFRPDIVRGYASSVFMLARYLIEKGVDDVRPRAVITAAETLFSSMRKTIEEAFGCPVFDFYASREIGAIASECEQHSGYHVSEENVCVEIVRRGEHVHPGEKGVILVTSLRNFSMPFIRYSIGDVATSCEETCRCGRGLALLSSIEGRVSEFMAVYDERQRRIVPVGPVYPVIINPAMHLPLESIRVIQESINRLLVKIVKGKGYSEKHTDFLLQHMQRYLGKDIEIDIEFVDYIPSLPSGKRSTFISKINPFEQN